MSSEVDKDLLKILQNNNISSAIRLKGWEYVLGMTGSRDGILKILSVEKYLQTILRAIKVNEKQDVQIHNTVLKCLINLSSLAEGSLAVINESEDFVSYLLTKISDPKFLFTESYCYILSNISSHCNLMEIKNFESDLLKLWKEKLLLCFNSKESNLRNQYKFLAMFFANITLHSAGRRLILEEDCLTTNVLDSCLTDDLVVRRLGIALLLRNCCSDTKYHSKLKEANLLPIILLPLMGPDEFEEEHTEMMPLECQYLEDTKHREVIPAIRKALVQALSLLCYTEECWSYLKSKGVYYIVRELHNWENDESVREAIETLVGYLLVEDYEVPMNTEVIVSETDLLRDIPDFVLEC